MNLKWINLRFYIHRLLKIMYIIQNKYKSNMYFNRNSIKIMKYLIQFKKCGRNRFTLLHFIYFSITSEVSLYLSCKYCI